MTTATAVATNAAPELSAEAFDILRSAVNLARSYSITRASVLLKRLQDLYPGRDAQVKEALAYWAHYHHTRPDDGQ